MSDKEAVDTVAHILTGLCNAVCCHKTGGKIELPNCECRQTARLVIEAIRPHILEEAARIADEMMNDAFSKSLNSKEPSRTAFRFRVETCRRIAAAIRAAKEGDK